jgi:chorismate synthase
VGDIKLAGNYSDYDLSLREENAVRCPDPQTAKAMEALIHEVKAEGDTIGGVITCVVKGCPVGLGEPEFGKLHAQLGAAMLSINAAKGFEYGEGFDFATHRGSEMNDVFTNPTAEQEKTATKQESGHPLLHTLTNHSGGIQGGISNGEDIYFRVAFKPVATLLREQQTVDKEGNPTTFTAQGRHDPCVLPRAVPVVEAMAAMVILDNYMLKRAKE